MLEEVLQMNSSNSQICLTPGEQIIKYYVSSWCEIASKFKGSCMYYTSFIVPLWCNEHLSYTVQFHLLCIIDV